MALSGREVWRDFNTDSVLLSGNHNPRKLDIRDRGTDIETRAGKFNFASRADAIAAKIPDSIHSVALNGDISEGDGLGGLFIDTDNGSADTFTSADRRMWYRVADVGRISIDAETSRSIPIIGESIEDIRTISVPFLLQGALANVPERRTYQYSDDADYLDNGVSVLKPVSIDLNDPGRWVMQPGVFDASFEMTMGAAGDFTSLGDALAFLSRFRPEYVYGRGGAYNKINLKIKAGNTVTEGICAEHGMDLSHIRVVSEDAIVQ